MPTSSRAAPGVAGRSFLIDTNILIALEDHASGGHVHGGQATRFSSLAAKHGYTIVVADGTRKDFLRANPVVAHARQRQLARYHVLGGITPTAGQQSRFKILPTASPNDRCDLEILCALDNNAAPFLVTEDRRLRKRAVDAGHLDKVLRLSDALALLESFESRAHRLPHLNAVDAYQVPRDASILDSVAADYPDFDGWWAKVQTERRRILVVGRPSDPEAICVLKTESGAPSNVTHVESSLKLCTFKVADGAPGKKYGELMLKAAVDEARARGLQAMFVTFLPDKSDFAAFVEKFGFKPVPRAVTSVPGELVYEKLLEPHGPELPALEHNIAYGPGSVRSDKAYIVPIRPEFAVELLPEANATVGLGLDLPTRACGNAIRKAYLSNTPTRSVAPGDLLCFYQSVTERAVIAVGVAEDTLVSRNVDELLAFVGVRTVYTPEQVANLVGAGEVVAVLFRFDRVVTPMMTYAELVSQGVLKSAPKSFVQVDSQKVGPLCQRLLT